MRAYLLVLAVIAFASCPPHQVVIGTTFSVRAGGVGRVMSKFGLSAWSNSWEHGTYLGTSSRRARRPSPSSSRLAS